MEGVQGPVQDMKFSSPEKVITYDRLVK
jgi:hypothetical protein